MKAGWRVRTLSIGSIAKKACVCGLNGPAGARWRFTARPDASPSRPDQAWSLDFVHDELSNGNKIRLLTAANPIQIISRKDWAWSALIVIGGERQSYFSPFIGLLCRNPTGDRREQSPALRRV